MADQADERLKALKASMKEALGKLTGSDELEAQGARERSRGDVSRAAASGKSAPRAKDASRAKTAPAPAAKAGTGRRRS